ncbi:MAG: hypothetical protein LIO79_10300 [Rikenellaceae bacterium]|nr:hypothetical protein [Rikenellaceae bacterium]
MKNKTLITAYQYCKDNGLYLGTGNPNAKILIVGKECAKSGENESITLELLKKWESELVDENLAGWDNYLYPF